MSWDNGRTLGLIVGEDRFSIRPPAPALLRLYMPMTADCYMQNEWGDLENEPNALDSRERPRGTRTVLPPPSDTNFTRRRRSADL